MYSLSNTTNLKLQIEQRVSYKLETANCTMQYLSPKNGCLSEAQTHDLRIRARHSSDETTCTLNSFYLVFIVLILYSHQVSMFMKQRCSTHNRFCSAKKEKKLSVWGSNSRPGRFLSMFAISIPQKRSCLCEVGTHDLHVIAWHSTTQKLPRMYHGGQKQTSINIAQTNILRTWLCETCSGSPQKCFCDCDNKVVLVYPHTYEVQASFFFLCLVSLATIWQGHIYQHRPQWQHTNCLNQVW